MVSGRLLGLLPTVWTGAIGPTQQVLAAEQAGKVGTGMTAAGGEHCHYVHGDPSVYRTPRVSPPRIHKRLGLRAHLSSHNIDSLNFNPCRICICSLPVETGNFVCSQGIRSRVGALGG